MNADERGWRRGFLSALICVSGLFAQTAPLKFEVASVRPAGSDGTKGSNWSSHHGSLTMRNVTLKQCIAGAYALKDYQVSGKPKWLEADRFDIVAKAESPDNERLLMPMLQTLLIERFQLATHRETKMSPQYVLVAGKNGPKLDNADPEAHGSNTRTTRGHLEATNTPMSQLVVNLSRILGMPVVDQTGLDGKFNLKLDWAPDSVQPGGASPNAPAENDAGPSIFTAIQQIGLKLDSVKAPLEILVIDRAEKPTEN